MRLTLTLDCDNAAFDPPEPEIARIFRAAAQAIEQEGAEPGRTFRVRDVNGNTVGIVRLDEAPEKPAGEDLAPVTERCEHCGLPYAYALTRPDCPHCGRGR